MPLGSGTLKDWNLVPRRRNLQVESCAQLVKTQKKISKRTKDNNKYYTYKMLNQNCKICRGILGLNPDKPEEPQLEDWLKKHPQKKAI